MKEAIVIAVVVFGAMLVWLFMHRERPMRFRPKSVLTGSELDFFFRLREALPECIVCPQVAVSALVEPTGRGLARQKALARIEGEKAGYAVFDEGMRLIAVVELDHRSRIKRRDAARDACLSSAGIRTVRFHAKRPPSTSQIRSRIHAQPRGQGRERSAELRARPVPAAWRNTTKIRI